MSKTVIEYKIVRVKAEGKSKSFRVYKRLTHEVEDKKIISTKTDYLEYTNTAKLDNSIIDYKVDENYKRSPQPVRKPSKVSSVDKKERKEKSRIKYEERRKLKLVKIKARKDKKEALKLAA